MNTRLLLTAKGVSIAVMVAGSRMRIDISACPEADRVAAAFPAFFDFRV